MALEERTRQWMHVPNAPERDVSDVDLDDVREGAQSLVERGEECIRATPWLSVMAAAGVGFILGMAVTKAAEQMMAEEEARWYEFPNARRQLNSAYSSAQDRMEDMGLDRSHLRKQISRAGRGLRSQLSRFGW
jgi:hypothetical protein